MSRCLVPVSIVLGLLGLAVACYGDVLFHGQQFAYRDAGHFYYPLYERVQAEWNAGRWPLWEPEENAGMPLLGNPTAAVLYPGKVLYALLPYAWAARLYIVVHELLAFAAMWFLLRAWGTSPAGAGLGAMGYAFGVPVLFQYCNIIFLVGAAWLPLGFHAVDRWLRGGQRAGLLELAIVLALQVMGGDPEGAYVLGLCAAGYALMLSERSAGAGAGAGAGQRRRVRGPLLAVACAALAVHWIAATLVLAAKLPAFRPARPPGKPPLAFRWMVWVQPAVAAAWGLVALWFITRWRRRRWQWPLGTRLAGLLGAAGLAAGLAAVQLFPILEFIGQSGRAAGQGPHDIYPFSLEPIRLCDLLWPSVFGAAFHGSNGGPIAVVGRLWPQVFGPAFHGNSAWLDLVPPSEVHAEVWVPSVYLGGLTLLLALGAIGFRNGPPWRGWLSAVAVVTALASLGKFTGPIWWARLIPACASWIGPHDGRFTTTIRLDSWLRDGDGSFYWFLAMVLPGFRQFRFPSKLLSFTALALCALAGCGWDRVLAAGRDGSSPRRLRWLAVGLSALSLTALAVVVLAHGPIQRTLARAAETGPQTPFGPIDPRAAFSQILLALLHGSSVSLIGWALVRWGRRAAGLASALALLVTAVDLIAANARYVETVPQHLLETRPRVVEMIEAAERKDPSPGPYRVHRMPYWEPMAWLMHASDERVRQFVTWERETIQPKYGLPYDVQYTLSLGFAELYDYEFYFGGFTRAVGPEAARLLHVPVGEKVVVFPRRAFDLWNSRYFILPVMPGGWTSEQRGYASFLPRTERVYPAPGAFDGPDAQGRQKRWLEHEDYQILRNLDAYPRAWVVHDARFLKPITGLERTDRDEPMEQILYPNDYLWHDNRLRAEDPHRLVWLDMDRWQELGSYLPHTLPQPSEQPRFTQYSPQRVEIDVTLEQPGVVVLADIYYPGWKLTIDGAAAPIYRANRLMRGAAVKAGRHRLVYTYEPRCFVLGGRITLASLVLLAVLGLGVRFRPLSTGLARPGETGPSSTPLPPEAPVLE